MPTPASPFSPPSIQPLPPWEPGTVVELPLLVTGKTVAHLERLASRKGMSIGSFIRSVLDESLAREHPDGLVVRSGPGAMAAWPGDCPAE